MKKVFILLVLCIVVVLGYVLYDNRTIATITLDINPSVMIKVGKGNKIKKVIPLNDDAKEIVKGIENISLDDVIKEITMNVIEKGYIKDNNVVVLIHTEGNINSNINDVLLTEFNSKEITVDIITIDNITSEDKQIAKKYNITPAKAAYIDAIDNVPVESLVSKGMSELRETKQTGNYCLEGYVLEGTQCLKEVSRSEAINGMVCPPGYYDYNGKCYEEVGADLGDTYCDNNFELKDNNCVETQRVDASKYNYKCSSGQLGRRSELGLPASNSGNDDYVCYNTTNAKEPTLRCLSNSGHIMLDGKCYNGPAPLINGGCPGNDVAINGWCYSKDDEDQWLCPDGRIYEKSKGTYPKYCPDTISYTEVSFEYKCEQGTLDGSSCIVEHYQAPQVEMSCPKGYTLTDGRCLGTKTVDKTDGYVCNGEARVEGNECVVYDIIESLKN